MKMNSILPFLLLLYITLSVCPLETINFSASNQSCVLHFRKCTIRSVTGCCYNDFCPTSFNLLSICVASCCQVHEQSNNSDEGISVLCDSIKSRSQTSLQGFSFKILGICIIGLVGCLVLTYAGYICCYRKSRRNIVHDAQGAIEEYTNTEVNLDYYNIQQQGPHVIDSQIECAICLDNMTNLHTLCGHFFHALCFKDWICKRPTSACPLCVTTKFNPVKLYCEDCGVGQQLFAFHHTPTKNHGFCPPILCFECQAKEVENQVQSPAQQKYRSKDQQTLGRIAHTRKQHLRPLSRVRVNNQRYS